MDDGREQDLRILVARAPDLDHARHVFQELQNHGVDAADVRLAGAAAARAERHTRDEEARERLDAGVTGHVARQVGGGAILGALGGATIGAVGGLLATSGDVGGSPTLFLVIVSVFAALGAWVAATLSATRSMGRDETWQLTFDDSDGATWIAIRVRDDEDATGTRELLRNEGITVVGERRGEATGANTVRWN